MPETRASSETSRRSGRSRTRLALIGGNIRQSRSPELHRQCGELTGLDVTYDLLVPSELDQEFETTFDACAHSDMRGVNVTYPYKERVTGLVACDPLAARIGSLNTVVFEAAGPVGYNTDYSGFLSAYRDAYPGTEPGAVAMVGAGGVGRAIAFALAELRVSRLSLFDSVEAKARALARDLAHVGVGAIVASDIASAVAGADGIVNSTPVGMNGYPGTPVPASMLGGRRWAFDAVYTPVDTVFMREADAAGLSVLSGYALFFHQGVDAFEHFTGRRPDDLGELRRRLEEKAPM
jgi:quinate/shikimate dehydrogenase (NAD+)